MRILFISEMVPWLPCHDGFRVSPANLLRHLSGRKNEVHLIALAQGGERKEHLDWARPYCQSVCVRAASGGMRARMRVIASLPDPSLGRTVREAVVNLRPDVIHLEGGGLAPILGSAAQGVPTVLSVHDSKELRYLDFAAFTNDTRKRLSLQLLAIIARRHERKWFSKADRVVAASRFDADALAASVSRDRIVAIPYGVDLEYYARQTAPEPGRIVFTGSMNWPPNEDAAEYFALQIMPTVRSRIRDASFWIVGANPTPRVQQLSRVPGVHVTGTVDDIRPWIWSAAVYASPLRFGLGVKNKILEAMASGAAVVATTRSLSGTPMVQGRDAMIADDAPKFADAVITLLSNPEMRDSIAREARRKAEKEYSWNSITGRLEDLYRDIRAQRQAAA